MTRRFYLGFALSLQKNGPGGRTQETIDYLQEGVEALLAQNTSESLTSGERYKIVLHNGQKETIDSSRPMANPN